MATTDESIKRNISQNITKYREKAGLSQKELAKRLNVTPSRISNWEQGANCPTIEILFEVCKILNVSINDIYGVYPDLDMRLSFDEREHLEKYRFISKYSTDGKEAVDYILNREYKIAEELKNSKTNKTNEISSELLTPIRIIQYFHSVSAGTGQVIFDDVYSERITIPDIPKYRRVAYAVKVSGHSMEPLYDDGDMLLIEPTCSIDAGEIGIFNVDGQAYVKKLGESELISLNTGYGNIELTDDARCMGRVVDKFTGNPLE